MALLNADILWHLFWLTPLFFILFIFGWTKRKKLLFLYLGERAKDPSFVLLSPAARVWKYLFLFLTVLSLFLALARPFWGMKIMPYAGEGRDLLILFDVSRSMLAKDVKPSRLEHAKFLVRELVKNNPADRFGLIAFAGKAFLECPMTMDKTSFLQNVDELDTSSIPVGGTNIEEALKTALAAFKGAESSHLAVILITDGDELTGQSSRVLKEAIRRKIPFFIAGVGDPSEPAIIQIRDEKGQVTTLRDEKGNVVNSVLNEKQLGRLAAETGGIYVRSTTSSTGLNELQARIHSLDKHLRERGKQYRPMERPLYPLSFALFFFLLFLLIPEKRGNKDTGKKVLLLPGLLLFFLSADMRAQEQALPAPASPPGSAQVSAPAGKQTNDPFSLYNSARHAHMEEKDLAKAENLYQQAINSAPEKGGIRESACLNLGVIRHSRMRQDVAQGREFLQKQDLQKALEKVKEAIRKTEAVQELYKFGLLGATARKAAHNQQLLLNEKREAEKLQKEIEELLKKQQQAQQNARNASDKQKQQQKEQNQKKKEEQKRSAQDQASKAKQNAQDMKKQAEKLSQKNMAQQALKAEKELEKALGSMKKGEDKKAEKHLEEALKALGNSDRNNKEKKENKNNQNGQQNKENEKNDPRKEGQKPQDLQDQSKQPKQQKPAGTPPEEKGDYDKKQAESLLELMVRDEKDLKDAMKKQMKQLQGAGKVEKDW